jgi:transcriptional regulator with XRE-family HTH domain
MAAQSPFPSPSTPPKGAFGAQVKAYRMRLGMNQRELAKAVDIDFGYMSKIENKGLIPSREKIEELATALKLRDEERDSFIVLGGTIPEATEEFVKEPPTRQLLRSLGQLAPDDRARLLEQFIREAQDRSRGGAT